MSGQYTYTELAKEARREMLMRERVYPNLIHHKRLSADEAARRIAMMTEIAVHFDELAKKEQLL